MSPNQVTPTFFDGQNPKVVEKVGVTDQIGSFWLGGTLKVKILAFFSTSVLYKSPRNTCIECYGKISIYMYFVAFLTLITMVSTDIVLKLFFSIKNTPKVLKKVIKKIIIMSIVVGDEILTKIALFFGCIILNMLFICPESLSPQ